MRTILLTRRKFIKIAGHAALFFFIPFSACRHIFKKDNLELSENNIKILEAVLFHLLPSNHTPGAVEAKTSQYFQNFVLKDKYLKTSKKSILISGIQWVEDEAEKKYSRSFYDLNNTEKEATLRKIEEFYKGRKWISYLLTYTFESLLGDPVYNINTKKTAWKWLNHTPGFPRPIENKIYGNYEL